MHTSHVKKFLLASKSSSRYRLLKNAGLAFQTAIPNCDEGRIKAQLLKSKISIKNLICLDNDVFEVKAFTLTLIFQQFRHVRICLRGLNERFDWNSTIQ